MMSENFLEFPLKALNFVIEVREGRLKHIYSQKSIGNRGNA